MLIDRVWVQYHAALPDASNGFVKGNFGEKCGDMIGFCRMQKTARGVRLGQQRGKAMSNVIRFFEVVGQSPELRHAKRGELKDALKRAQIDSTLQSAILDRDIVEMHALLDTQNRIYCSVFPVKVPEKKPTKAPPKKPGKAPAKKPAKKTPGKGKK